MNLPFLPTYPKSAGNLAGMDTHFVEKIWAGIPSDRLNDFFLNKYGCSFFDREAISKLFADHNIFISWGKYNLLKENNLPKTQTIRRDRKQLWKPRKHITFTCSSPDTSFQFAPILQCKQLHKIEVCWLDPDGFTLVTPVVYIDDVWVTGTDLISLTSKDGFDSLSHFYSWFSEDYSGKIISWAK